MRKKHDMHLEMLRTQGHKFCTHLAFCDITPLKPPNKYTVPFIRAHQQHDLWIELPILLLIKSSEKVRACQSNILSSDVCTVISLCRLWSLKWDKKASVGEKKGRKKKISKAPIVVSELPPSWRLDFFFQVEQISFLGVKFVKKAKSSNSWNLDEECGRRPVIKKNKKTTALLPSWIHENWQNKNCFSSLLPSGVNKAEWPPAHHKHGAKACWTFVTPPVAGATINLAHFVTRKGSPLCFFCCRNVWSCSFPSNTL